MLKEIIIAIRSFGRAHAFIMHHRLWKWILLPGLLYMLLFMGGMYIFSITVGSFVQNVLLNTVDIRAWANRIDSSFVHFLLSFSGMAIWLVLFLFYFSFFKFCWLIVGSPLFAWLSERTEAIETGQGFSFSYPQLTKDILRGIRVALRNALWQTVYFLAFLLCAFVPVAGWVVPLYALLTEAYYLGYSMLDYSLARSGQPAEASARYIGARKGLALGNGMVFYLMHLVPVAGWILAPAYAVIAATLSLMDEGEEG